MRLEQFPSVLETTGRLIRDYGRMAVREAMQRALTADEHGNWIAQTFWLDVLAEAIDVLIVVGSRHLDRQSEDATADCSGLLLINLMLFGDRTYDTGYSVGIKRCIDWPYRKLTAALDMFWRAEKNIRQSEMSWGIADAIADRMLQLTPALSTLLAPWGR
jgi:hypothetical protein